jgi:anti-sigma factor RsiW
MTECWSEGDLRAFLDGELPPSDRERVNVHIGECPKCEALYDEIVGRASRVEQWMSLLPDTQEAVRLPLLRRPVRKRPRWAGVAAALAAGVLIALAVWPKHSQRPVLPAVVELPPVQPPRVAQAVSVEPGAMSDKHPVTRARRPLGIRSAKASLVQEEFVALDDEPIGNGLVVRMALGPDEVQADVIFSADGRARAYRLVK